MTIQLRNSQQASDRASLTISVRGQNIPPNVAQALEALQRNALRQLDEQAAVARLSGTQRANLSMTRLGAGIWDTGKTVANQWNRSGAVATLNDTAVTTGRYIGTPGGGIALYELRTGIIVNQPARSFQIVQAFATPTTWLVTADSLAAGDFQTAWDCHTEVALSYPAFKPGASADSSDDSLARAPGQAEVVLKFSLMPRDIDASITAVALKTLSWEVLAMGST